MKKLFARAGGALLEGLTGLCGLAGAKTSAPAITHSLLLQAMAHPTPLSVEELQAIVATVMQIIIGIVTVWRMIKPRKVVSISTDSAPIGTVPDTSAAPAPPANAFPPPIKP